jgi:hypothetical protein
VRTILSNSVLVGAIVLCLSCPSLARGLSCPGPSPSLERQVSTPAMTIDAESLVFSYKSKSYPVDIYSAFLPQSARPSNFCIRYEAINRASTRIEKFNWPLAGIQTDSFEPQQLISIVVTRPPGREPTPAETWLYAFLNASAKSFAFQTRAENHPYLRVAMNQLGSRDSSSRKSSDVMVQFAAADPIEQTLSLDKPNKFSEVGSQFSVGAEEFSAASQASWNGKTSNIEIILDRGSENTTVFAPITYALYKSGNASSFLGLIREFKNAPIPFADKSNTFAVSSNISPENFGAGALYVIEQPITLVSSQGRTCFSSPVYSPIPVPADLLRCDLF